MDFFNALIPYVAEKKIGKFVLVSHVNFLNLLVHDMKVSRNLSEKETHNGF